MLERPQSLSGVAIATSSGSGVRGGSVWPDRRPQRCRSSGTPSAATSTRCCTTKDDELIGVIALRAEHCPVARPG